jgi:hypothetical protein
MAVSTTWLSTHGWQHSASHGCQHYMAVSLTWLSAIRVAVSITCQAAARGWQQHVVVSIPWLSSSSGNYLGAIRGTYVAVSCTQVPKQHLIFMEMYTCSYSSLFNRNVGSGTKPRLNFARPIRRVDTAWIRNSNTPIAL